MSSRGFIASLCLTLAVVAGCSSKSSGGGLAGFELDFIEEDVLDMMTVVFQTGELAYVGDVVLPGDVTDPARPGNGFIVSYDLPPADRPGLGLGFGAATLQVFEDGVVNQNPLGFSFLTTTADSIELTYTLVYRGEAVVTARLTNVDLFVSIIATRTGPNSFRVDYLVQGICDLGQTLCDVDTQFFAAGRPRDGIEPGEGGIADIDDPDVIDIFFMNIDYFLDHFDAFGDVGCCAFYDEPYFYDEFF